MTRTETKCAMITSVSDVQCITEFTTELLNAGRRPMVTVEYGKNVRTPAQNRALHVFLGQLAEVLGAAGLDMRRTLKESIDIPWTKESCKQYLWRPIQKAVTQQESTTTISKEELPLIYDTLARHLAEKHGVRVPDWPVVDEQPPLTD